MAVSFTACKAQIPLQLTQHDTTCSVMSTRDVTCRVCSNMADEEAMMIACTSLVFCALGVSKSGNMQGGGTRLV